MENNFEIDKINACKTEIKSPLFSIITINRNNAEGLRKTMQSVLTQDFSDYEYIIIDGASTDGSVDIIREFLAVPEYAEKISYWVSEPDSGIYNAMNKGIRHATGEFVNMMNSGDAMLPEVLGRVAKIAREHTGEVLYGAVNRVKNGIYVETCGGGDEFIYAGTLQHQACFFPLKFHKEYGLYDESYLIASDYDFIAKLYVNNELFCHVNYIICDYDIDGFSVKGVDLLKKEFEKIQIKYGFIPNPQFYKLKRMLKTILKFILPGFVVIILIKIKNIVIHH